VFLSADFFHNFCGFLKRDFCINVCRLAFLIGYIIAVIVVFALERSVERFNAPEKQYMKQSVNVFTQEYEQNMKNFHQKRREILAEVEKYN
jgi:hypothetical protein